MMKIKSKNTDNISNLIYGESDSCKFNNDANDDSKNSYTATTITYGNTNKRRTIIVYGDTDKANNNKSISMVSSSDYIDSNIGNSNNYSNNIEHDDNYNGIYL